METKIMEKPRTIGTVERERERELYSREKKNSFVRVLSICTITNNYMDNKQGRNTFINDIKNADYKYRLNLKSSLLFDMPKGVMDTG